MVLQECSNNQDTAAALDNSIKHANIELLDDSQISGTVFLQLLETFRLGEGETECLAFALLSEVMICCDDSKARTVIASRIGQGRVTGSLGLIRAAVKERLLTIDDAWRGYNNMKSAGGFLPVVETRFFED